MKTVLGLGLSLLLVLNMYAKSSFEGVACGGNNAKFKAMIHKTPMVVYGETTVNYQKRQRLIDSSALSGYKGIYEIGTVFDFAYDRSYSEPLLDGTKKSKSFGFEPSYIVKITQGYTFKNRIFIGIGSGLRINSRASDIRLPLFFEARAVLTNKRIAPYISQQIGYALAFFPYSNISTIGGAHYDSHFGVRYIIKKRLAFNISIGYCLYNNKERFTLNNGGIFPQPYGTTYTRSVQRVDHGISVKTGLSF